MYHRWYMGDCQQMPTLTLARVDTPAGTRAQLVTLRGKDPPPNIKKYHILPTTYFEKSGLFGLTFLLQRFKFFD